MRFKISSNETNVKQEIIDYFISNCSCKIVDEDYDLHIIINKTDKNSNMIIKDSKVFIYAGDDISIKDFCDKLIERYNIESINFISGCRDIDTITNKEDKVKINYDKIHNVISRGVDDPYIPEESANKAHTTKSRFYSVRSSLNNSESEKWCGESLTHAIRECDKYTGYKVFSDTGDIIYTSNKYKVILKNNDDSGCLKTRMLIRNKGLGIKVLNNDSKLVSVPDGTEVIVSKISSKKSEIIIHLDGEIIKTEVATSILSRM